MQAPVKSCYAYLVYHRCHKNNWTKSLLPVNFNIYMISKKWSMAKLIKQSPSSFLSDNELPTATYLAVGYFYSPAPLVLRLIYRSVPPPSNSQAVWFRPSTSKPHRQPPAFKAKRTAWASKKADLDVDEYRLGQKSWPTVSSLCAPLLFFCFVILCLTYASDTGVTIKKC